MQYSCYKVIYQECALACIWLTNVVSLPDDGASRSSRRWARFSFFAGQTWLFHRLIIKAALTIQRGTEERETFPELGRYKGFGCSVKWKCTELLLKLKVQKVQTNVLKLYLKTLAAPPGPYTGHFFISQPPYAISLWHFWPALYFPIIPINSDLNVSNCCSMELLTVCIAWLV